MPAIYDLLTMPKTLRLAWSKVKQRNSAAGIDEQTVADFDRDCGRQLQILSDQLKSGNYKQSLAKICNTSFLEKNVKISFFLG